MQNDKEAQKIRVKKVLINFQRGAPPETAGVDIEKCVNEAYDFFGDRVVSDRELLDICFLMIIRIIDPLAREFIDSRKSAWAQHPEIKTLGELEKKHFGYLDIQKLSLETASPKLSPGLGIITPDPMLKMLGPEYMRFASPFGIKGGARESANRVDLVAVGSDEEGTGHFEHSFVTARQTMPPFVFGSFGTMLSAQCFGATDSSRRWKPISSNRWLGVGVGIEANLRTNPHDHP
jgi:hypothetical protein